VAEGTVTKETLLKSARISTYCQLVLVAFLAGYTRGWELPALSFGQEALPYSSHYFFLVFLILLQIGCLLINETIFLRILALLAAIGCLIYYFTRIFPLKRGIADEINYTSYWIRESYSLDIAWGILVMTSIFCMLATFFYSEKTHGFADRQ
jgi:hypothetical protein